jgi:hypothetical protein
LEDGLLFRLIGILRPSEWRGVVVPSGRC